MRERAKYCSNTDGHVRDEAVWLLVGLPKEPPIPTRHTNCCSCCYYCSYTTSTVVAEKSTKQPSIAPDPPRRLVQIFLASVSRGAEHERGDAYNGNTMHGIAEM